MAATRTSWDIALLIQDYILARVTHITYDNFLLILWTLYIIIYIIYWVTSQWVIAMYKSPSRNPIIKHPFRYTVGLYFFLRCTTSLVVITLLELVTYFSGGYRSGHKQWGWSSKVGVSYATASTRNHCTTAVFHQRQRVHQQNRWMRSMSFKQKWRSDCQNLIVKILSSRSDWQELIVKILLSRSYCQGLIVKVLLSRSCCRRHCKSNGFTDQLFWHMFSQQFDQKQSTSTARKRNITRFRSCASQTWSSMAQQLLSGLQWSQVGWTQPWNHRASCTMRQLFITNMWGT